MMLTALESLSEISTAIEETLECLVPAPQPGKADYQLLKGGRYTLFAPSKRIRPLLVAATTLALSGEYKAALLPGCSLELIHTYSLIHDDLPCMDNDDFRRGQPSLHKFMEEGEAVLVGDFFLTYAFEVLSDAPLLSDRQKLSLIKLLAQASGAQGMIAGQSLDIQEAHSASRSQRQREINHLKTAALFRVALEFGAVIGNATPSQHAELRTLGMQLGDLFQAVDDVIDNDKNLCKEALEQERTNALENFESLLQKIRQLDGNSEPLTIILKKIIKPLL